MVNLTLATVLALSASVIAAPRPFPTFQKRQSCRGQSCQLADLARSSGNPAPARLPDGGSEDGKTCIVRLLKQMQSEGRIDASDNIVIPPRKREAEPEAVAEPQLGGLGTGACKPYTLIFARGTTEAGGMGSTVGPGLQNGLNSKMRNQWAFVGVSKDYPANMLGNDCLGIPGGIAMMRYIEDQVQKCPDTKIVAAGYSQGAMAVHNGIAYAKPEARAKVVGAVVVGDPMNGAPIKGFAANKVKTVCSNDDGVCQGKFSITPGHLAYTFGANSGVSQAVDWIVKNVGA